MIMLAVTTRDSDTWWLQGQAPGPTAAGAMVTTRDSDTWWLQVLFPVALCKQDLAWQATTAPALRLTVTVTAGAVGHFLGT